jgi:TRAP-type C4-dicarboxylate transport system permease small subunit
MMAAFAVFIFTFKQAGGDMTAGTVITALPPSVIALLGWANRLLILAYCAWAIFAAWYVIAPRIEAARAPT